MAISMGGRPPSGMPVQSAPADQVTITPTEDGGFAVECLRDGRPSVSTYPDAASTMGYVEQELGGSAPIEPEMAVMEGAPLHAPPEEMV